MTPLLNLQHVSLSMPGCDHSILHDIHYQIHSGDFIVVLGHNGSGKSSLLKILQRQYVMTDGQIQFNQMPLEKISKKEFCKTVKTVTQHTHDSLFSSLTVFENYVLTKTHYHDKEFLKSYLNDFNPNLSRKLDIPISSLSGGEQQILVLALTLLQPPQLLLLDEHTSALDPKTQETVLTLTQQAIKKFSLTCVMVTHDLSIASRYGNRLLVLKNGQLFRCFNEKEKILLSENDLRDLFY